MKQKKSITKQFYKDVPTITGNVGETPCFSVEEFASMSMEAVYVLDFFKRNFHFVANRDFFLCGHSVDEARSLGYEFFPEVIHKDDLPLLAEMHAAILIRLCCMSEPHKNNYFSFAVRIKNRVGHLMVYHKLKPIFVDGHLRYGLCLLSSSVLNASGHLCAHYANGIDFDEYTTTYRRWQKNTNRQPLSEREKDVLKLLKQGKKNNEIGSKPRKPGLLPISIATLRNDLDSIFEKLDVSTRMQAVIYATNRHLVYSSCKNPEKQKKAEEMPEKKKRGRPMTSEKRALVQEALDKCNILMFRTSL